MRNYKRITSGLFINFLIICNLFSQHSNSNDHGLGKFLKWSKNESSINITTENSKLEIKPWTDQSIRIRVTTLNSFSEDFSYATSGAIQKIKWYVEDQKTSLWIHTDSIDMEVSKNPVLIKFYNKQGKLVLANDNFGHYYSGNELTCYNKLNQNERFIGLGEKTGNLDRRGNAYTNWNTDCFGYTPDTDPLYSSIPFYIGIHDSLVYGVFLDQSTKSHFNFGASNIRFSSFSVEAPEIKYFYIAGNSIPGIIKNYTYLTGRMPMPPKWSLGYHQSKWSYFPDSRVINLAKTFRQKDIPLDVIHLDIHYMDEYKIFTWNKNKFPDPAGMVKELKSLGVNTTVIIDPGIKVDTTYNAFKTGLKEDIFLKYPDNTLYSGSVWPGLCHFPDFTLPKTRSWWGKSFKTYTDTGIEGYWNDMNEPATWGQRFPSLINYNFEGHSATTLDARNIYGMQMARATYEGTKELLNKRPFVLTRAGFSGMQRYTAIWTGDNTATEDHLLLGIRLVNSIGLSGVAFCGTDVGGFAGETTNSLYARWLTVGTFTPFFRGHKSINMKDSEPWAFGEETEEIARNYIKLRYKLMPYIYSCFHEASISGLPVARTLAINHPHDPKVYYTAYQNQYLFGPSILIAASKSTESFVEVYFPKGSWYNLYTGARFNGETIKAVPSPIYKLAAFVKASAIIPAQKAFSSISNGIIDTLDIHVYKGDDFNTFVLYEDDGSSFNYEKLGYYMREISYSPGSGSIKLSKVTGSFTPTYKIIRMLLHGFEDSNSYQLNSQRIKTKKINFSWLDLYKHLYYAPNESEIVEEILLKNNIEEIKLSWN